MKSSESGLARIGSAIRDRRRRLGKTLRELAAESGLSAPFLSQVERDQALPSLVSLTAIAHALGVEMSYFVGTPPRSEMVRRASAPEHLDVGDSPVRYVRLSGSHAERKLEALQIEVPEGLSAPTARREGEGFWFILEGQLEVWVGGEHFLLSPGDSTHFDQRHPYRMKNPGPGPLRMLWVGTPSLL